MLHIIFTVIFITFLAKWLDYETKRNADLIKYTGWIGAALASQLIASIASQIVGGRYGNIILHGIGGGVASAFLFVYLIKTFKVKAPWRLEFAMLFAFASSLGVLNELAEYALELLLGIVMSVDTHDTWRDFVANTCGALLAWLAVKIILHTNRASSKQG